jgi:hypothetical protein
METVLTRAEVEAHEKRLRRLLLGDLIAIATIALGVVLWSGAGKVVGIAGVIGLMVQGFRGWAYMMKDLRLRGRSPLWSFGLGGIFGFIAWLIWRSSHPIPTKD